MPKTAERCGLITKLLPIFIMALICPYAQAVVWIPERRDIQGSGPFAGRPLNIQPNAYGFSAYKTAEGKIILVGPNDSALHSLWEFGDVLRHPLSEEEYRQKNHIGTAKQDR